MKQGELNLLRRQIQERFGAVPDWVEQRLSGFSPDELEDLSVHLLKATSLEELLEG